MANQSMKQEIINSMVQKALAEKRNQEIAALNADFAAFQEQQKDPAALQADFDAFMKTQQPTQPAQSVQSAQPVQQATVNEIKAKSAPIPSLKDSMKNFSAEDYMRQQQEEQMAAEQKYTDRGNEKWNRSVLNTVAGLNSKDVQDTRRLAELAKMEGGPAKSTADKVSQWLSPDYKLSDKDKEQAKAYASNELQKFNYGSNRQPLFENEEDRQHYADMVNLLNKTNAFTNAMAGVIKQPYNLGKAVGDAGRSLGNQLSGLGAAITDKLGITEGATQRHNESVEAADNYFNQNNENMRQAFSNAQKQNPGAYTAGEIGGQVGMYALTNPLFGFLGAAAGLGKAGSFALNQVGQNAQDLALDTLPTLNQYMEGGLTDEEKTALLQNIGLNAAGNLVMGAAGEGISAIAKNRAAKKASDAAFRENVREGADKLAKLAETEDLDNIIRNATRQSEEAAQSIENIAKQMPDAGNIAGETANMIKPTTLSPELKAEVDNATEYLVDVATDLQSKAARSGDEKLIAKSDKLFEAMDNYVELVNKSNDSEAIRDANDNLRKALNQYIYRAKQVDPNIVAGVNNPRTQSGSFERLTSMLDDYYNPERKAKASQDFASETLKLEGMDPERAEAISRGYNYDYKGVPTEYNDKIVEPEKLVYKLTGKPVSPEFAAAVRTLDAGEPITSKEYNAIPEIAEAKAKATTGQETININTPEREQLRNKIRQDLNNFGSAEEYYDPVEKKMKVRYNGSVERGHRADIVIGLPSSGKSSAIVDPISYKYKSKLLDSDEAKKLIPEFDDGWGAGNVHEESKIILENAKYDAIDNGENIVLPIVGSNPDKVRREIMRLKERGYEVHLHLNDLDSNKAAGRNLRRLANDGRFLDLDSTSFEYGDKPRDVYNQLKNERGLLDGYSKISNDVRLGEKPVQLEGTEDIDFNWRDHGQSGRIGGTDSGTANGGMAPEAEQSISYDGRDNRPGRGEYSQEPSEVYRGGAPEEAGKNTSPSVIAEDTGIPKNTQEPQSVKETFKIEDTPENAPTGPRPEPSEVIPPEGMNERGQSKHIRGAGKMQMEDVADEVVADFQDNPDLYKVLRNADTKAKAENIYNTSDDPLLDFRDMLKQKDPAALPLGQQLAKDYSAAGNHAAAAQIYREMGEELTKAGQFSQAAVINMMKNDPLTALQYAEREINKLNQNGAQQFGKKWKNFELTDAERALFNDINPGDEAAIKAVFDQIGERLGKEYPTTFMDKLLEGRKIAMLFNLRTNVRNFGANVPTLGMRWMSDRVEAVGQNIAHLINPEFEVTQAVRGSGRKGRKIATEAFNSQRVQSLLDNTSGKYEIPSLKSSLVQNKQMYKGTRLEKWIDKVTGNGIQKVNEKLFGKKGVQSGLETIRNATYKMLDLGDSPFVKENFVERLGSYIRAQGINSVDEIPDEAIQMAWEEAMKATYKDNSWAVQMLGGIKKGIEKIPGVGRPLSQAAIPFLQAPGNIAARMVDYSPIKASKGVADIIAGATKNDVKQVSKGIEEAAKGLTGTGLVLLGMKLRDSGLITGTYSDDKDQKAFEKQNGFKEFALHVGDKYFTYDWMQPFAEPLIIGTLLSDAINKSDEYNSDLLNYLGIDNPIANKALGVALEGGKASVNSWFNASPLQGLQELMSGGYNGTDIAQNLIDTGISDFAGAFVPASVNAVAKSVDPVQRNTYDPSSRTGTFVNQQIAKIPGLSKTLPSKYDTWGREMKYADSKAMATASRFVIPGDYSYDKSDSVDKEINRLFEATNNAAVFPQVAPNAVGDKKLNNKEISTYQKDMGERNRKLAEKLINSSEYKKMDDKEKAEALSKLYGISKAITERDKFGKQLPESSQYKKYVQAYDKAKKGTKGADAILDELSVQNTLSKYNLSDSKVTRDIIDNHSERFLENYAKVKANTKDSNSSENIQKAIDKLNVSKSDKAQYYSYLKPDSNPGANPYGYIPGLNYDPKEDKSYQSAKSFIPSLSPENYYKTKDTIDSNSSNTISQEELLNYINNSGMSDNDAQAAWSAYGGWTNKAGEKKKLEKQGNTWISKY